MCEVNREAKGNFSSSIELLERIRSAAVTTEAIADVQLPPVDVDHLLLSRGWVAVDRGNGHAIYDWPPSAPDADHETTYLILDLTGDEGLSPYRVSVVDGERVIYDTASALVTNLNQIEARRCAACQPGGSVKEESYETSNRQRCRH